MSNLTREEVLKDMLIFVKGAVKGFCLDSFTSNLVQNAESFSDLMTAMGVIGLCSKDARLLEEEDYDYIRKTNTMNYTLPDLGSTPNEILLSFFDEESVEYISLLSAGDLGYIYLDGEFISAGLNKPITKSMLNKGIASLLTVGPYAILIN